MNNSESNKKGQITALFSNKTILITSHILESLLSLCDLLSYLNNGVIQFSRERKDFSSVEKEIFSVNQERLDNQIQYLIGN